jgi:uncharacterized RDD family membrane protein YckC
MNRTVFCPSCGVKNEDGVSQCFICSKPLPSMSGGDRVASPPDRGLSPSRQRAAAREAASGPSFASVGDRGLALLFDRVVLAALLLIPAALIGETWGADKTRVVPSLWSVAAGAGIFIVIVFLYHFIFESAFGSTLGKVILGLHVHNEGERGRIASTAIRNALRVIDALGFYAVGFFIVLFSRRKQRLGDHLAEMIVVEEPLHWGGRLAFILLWIAVIAGSVWAAALFCPECVASRPAVHIP